MNREQSEKLLAAYLLDELDAATRAQLEDALQRDPQLRDCLADMRMALKLVRQGFCEERQPQLSDARRQALLNEVTQARDAAVPAASDAGVSPASPAGVSPAVDAEQAPQVLGGKSRSWWRRRIRIKPAGAPKPATRGVRPVVSWAAAVAASLLLVAGLWSLYSASTSPAGSEVAVGHTKASPSRSDDQVSVPYAYALHAGKAADVAPPAPPTGSGNESWDYSGNHAPGTQTQLDGWARYTASATPGQRVVNGVHDDDSSVPAIADKTRMYDTKGLVSATPHFSSPKLDLKPNAPAEEKLARAGGEGLFGVPQGGGQKIAEQGGKDKQQFDLTYESKRLPGVTMDDKQSTGWSGETSGRSLEGLAQQDKDIQIAAGVRSTLDIQNIPSGYVAGGKAQGPAESPRITVFNGQRSYVAAGKSGQPQSAQGQGQGQGIGSAQITTNVEGGYAPGGFTDMIAKGSGSASGTPRPEEGEKLSTHTEVVSKTDGLIGRSPSSGSFGGGAAKFGLGSGGGRQAGTPPAAGLDGEEVVAITGNGRGGATGSPSSPAGQQSPPIPPPAMRSPDTSAQQSDLRDLGGKEAKYADGRSLGRQDESSLAIKGTKAADAPGIAPSGEPAPANSGPAPARAPTAAGDRARTLGELAAGKPTDPAAASTLRLGDTNRPGARRLDGSGPQPANQPQIQAESMAKNGEVAKSLELAKSISGVETVDGTIAQREQAILAGADYYKNSEESPRLKSIDQLAKDGGLTDKLASREDYEYRAAQKKQVTEAQQAINSLKADRASQTPRERQDKVDQLVQRAKTLIKQEDYKGAANISEQLLQIEPTHGWANENLDMLQHLSSLRSEGGLVQQRKIEESKQANANREAEIPWAVTVKYPDDWQALVEKRAKLAQAEAETGKLQKSEREDVGVSKSDDTLARRVAKDEFADKVALKMDGGVAGDLAKTKETLDADNKPVLKRDQADIQKMTQSLKDLKEENKKSELTAQVAVGIKAPATTQPAMATRGDTAETAEQALPSASMFREVPANPWVLTERDRFSTFASDVDTASYTLCRSYIRGGYLPPRGAVRAEEFINAFDYNYPRQAAGVFNVFAEAAANPFAESGQNTVLLKVGVQGRVIGREGRKTAHLVFVVDTSGSMSKSDRLPLIQDSIKMLTSQLGAGDRVSLITYNRQTSLVLECVGASQKDRIAAACDAMRAGGPTNLLEGLQAGYRLAQREFKAGQINRVILCTDGAANIGQTDSQAILDSVASCRKQGITLTVAGFGRSSLNDEMLETLAKKGDGSYMFIDSHDQARSAMVDKMNASLQTIALDSRIQVEFNPQRVRRYRLIGYEKRAIADEDFRNDTIAAAAVGSGQSSTALYELELADNGACPEQSQLGTVYVRYRNADTREMEEISQRLEGGAVRQLSVQDSPRFYLAACAGRFAEILRESPHAKNGNLQQVQRVLLNVQQALPLDDKAAELLGLVQQADGLPRCP